MILSFLNSLGFYVSGKTYLCFCLKDKKSIDIGTSTYDKLDYAQLFTTLAERNKTITLHGYPQILLFRFHLDVPPQEHRRDCW